MFFIKRANKIDLLLTFAATFALTVAFWPRNAPLQVVRCLDQERGWNTYSVSTDDPALGKLRDKLDRWRSPEYDPAYAAAKYRKELAERYRDELAQTTVAEPLLKPVVELPSAPAEVPAQAATARLSDTVTFASYEQEIADESKPETADAQPDAVQLANAEIEAEIPVVTSPSDADYWDRISKEAEAEMRRVEEARSEPPIVFGALLPPSLPKRAFHAAFLFGILGACLYMHWLVRCPYRYRAAFYKQAPSVLLRQLAFLATNVFALVSSWMAWA